MWPAETLALLKYLVSRDQFYIVSRKRQEALPVARSLAKTIVQQLTMQDFRDKRRDINNPKQFIWIFITDDEQKYYLKFTFINQETEVKFISFHISNY